MAKLSRQTGTTSQIVNVFALDTTSTTGAGKTGLTNSNFTAYYKRNTGSASVVVTLDASSGVTLGTYEPTVASHGAIKEIDSTNMPGLYEFQLPNNALASGADEVALMLTGTGIRVNPIEIELTATNNQDGTRGGMTALPNAAANANGGLPILSVSGTTLGYTVTTVTTVTNQLTAAAIATGVWQDTTSGDFTVASSIGKSLYTSGAAPGASSGLALVGSNMGNVTVTTNNDKTGYSLATAPPTSAAIATAVWTDLTSSSDFSTASSIGALLKADINAPIGSIPTNPYTGTPPTVAQIATAVWQDTTAGDFTTAASIGKSLGGAFTALGNSVFTVAALANGPGGGGSDPLANQVPGTYASGTAGAVLGALASAQVTVGAPVALGGNVTLIQGDSYFAADNRALLWTNAAGTWPNLTSATVTLTTYPPSGGATPLTVTVVTPSGPNQQLKLELSGAQTTAMAQGVYPFLIRATLSSGHVVTLVDATWTVGTR